MENDRSEWVMINEAARLLGKTKRTLRRYVSAGKMPVKDTPTGRMVDISGFERANQGASGDMTAGVSEAVTSRSEVDRLQETIRSLTDERDWLRARVEHFEAIFAMQSQKMLPAPRRRPWWAFWQRDIEAEGKE